MRNNVRSVFVYYKIWEMGFVPSMGFICVSRAPNVEHLTYFWALIFGSCDECFITVTQSAGLECAVSDSLFLVLTLTVNSSLMLIDLLHPKHRFRCYPCHNVYWFCPKCLFPLCGFVSWFFFLFHLRDLSPAMEKYSLTLRIASQIPFAIYSTWRAAH